MKITREIRVRWPDELGAHEAQFDESDHVIREERRRQLRRAQPYTWDGPQREASSRLRGKGCWWSMWAPILPLALGVGMLVGVAARMAHGEELPDLYGKGAVILIDECALTEQKNGDDLGTTRDRLIEIGGFVAAGIAGVIAYALSVRR